MFARGAINENPIFVYNDMKAFSYTRALGT